MYYRYFLLIIFGGVGSCYDMLRIRNTSYGYVNGIKLDSITCDNGNYGFFGIPYGEIGDQRFEDSLPPPKWSKIRNFTSYGRSCSWNVNNKSRMSNECLNLNIFTTKYCLLHGDCPVLLVFYGNEVNFNETKIFNTEYTFKDFITNNVENIVYVIGNHRDGIMGNLNLNSKFSNISINTNVGLFDIQKSLKWIRNEIKSFGGNGKDITLMGIGDSAIEVNMLRYLDEDRILFDKLILIPLTSIDNWIHQNNSEEIGRKIAISVGCANEFTDWNSFLQLEGVIGCMKFVDEGKLIEYENKLKSSGYQKPLPFIDYGNNSFFQYYNNNTKIRRENVPVLVVGSMIDDRINDSQSICRFFVNYYQYDNDSMLTIFNNSMASSDDTTSDDILDENLGLYLGAQNECMINFNSTNGSFIYHFNFQSLYSSFIKFPLLSNKSIYDIEGLFTLDRNDNHEMFDVTEELFRESLMNFINTDSFGDEKEIIYNFNINLDHVIVIKDDDYGIIGSQIEYTTMEEQIKKLINYFIDILKKYLYGEEVNDQLLPLFQNGEIKKLINITILFPPDINVNSTMENINSKTDSSPILNLNTILLIIIILYQIFFYHYYVNDI